MSKHVRVVVCIVPILTLCNPLFAQPDQSVGIIEVLEPRASVMQFGSNASSRLLLEEQSINPGSLVDVIERAPGIVRSGQNGLFQVFSIRGITGQRIQTRFAGVPIFTERRAGTGASFIDPWFMSQVSISRGPNSTYFGSGAIGGAVLISPRFSRGVEAELSYESGSILRSQSFGMGNANWSLGVSNRGAGLGETPGSDPLNSGFEQSSVLLQNRAELGELNINSLILSSRARDIGRSNSLFPVQQIGRSPSADHDLVNVAVESKKGWQGQIYGHDQRGESETREFDGRVNTVDSSSFDWGGRLQFPWSVQALSGQIGTALDFRDDVRADEIEQDFLGAGPRSQVNLSAEEQSVALFATGAINLLNHSFQFGLRHNWFQQTAAGEFQRNENFTTGFVGWEWFVSDNWSVSAEAASAFRIPSLTERFFSGTTARGTTVGNSNLRAEQAPGLDLGAHWKHSASFVNTHVFQQSFRDYIERTIIDPQTRGFSNLNEGNIYGLEIDGEIGLPDNFAASFNAHWIEGEDENGNTIADIPAAELGIGLNYRTARGQARLYWRHRFNKTDAALTEQAMDSANVVDLDYRYSLSEHSAISFYLRNALNDSYVISSDEISTLANRRSAGVKVNYQFSVSD